VDVCRHPLGFAEKNALDQQVGKEGYIWMLDESGTMRGTPTTLITDSRFFSGLVLFNDRLDERNPGWAN